MEKVEHPGRLEDEEAAHALWSGGQAVFNRKCALEQYPCKLRWSPGEAPGLGNSSWVQWSGRRLRDHGVCGLVGRGFQEALLITSTALSGPPDSKSRSAADSFRASLQHCRAAAVTPASMRLVWERGQFGDSHVLMGEMLRSKSEERAGSLVDLTFLVNVHFLELKFPKSPALPEKKICRKRTFDKVLVELHTEGV